MSIGRIRRPAAGPDPLRFRAAVRLTKREAFDACQALADADRFLRQAGASEAAVALGDLFELLEERLTSSPRTGPGRRVGGSSARPQPVSSSTNSSEREFTQ